MALGARRSTILLMMAGDGGRMVAIGLGLGIVGSLMLTGLMSSLLFGVGARDPFILITVIAALGLTSMAACCIPARRATRIDPLGAIRYE